MFRLVAADLRRNALGALAIVLIVAFAAALGVAVTLQERALRLGSARAAAAFPVIVGAAGSETQLILSAVFLQPAPLGLVPGRVLAALAADPRVAWAAPVGFGDFVEDYPIVGTTQALVDGLGGLREGQGFARLDQAVVGAHVQLRTGDRFHPLHGQASSGGHMHGETTYEVVGRLAPTGTPWDRAVLVPIEAVWRTHGMEALEEAAEGAHGHAGETPGEDGHAGQQPAGDEPAGEELAGDGHADPAQQHAGPATDPHARIDAARVTAAGAPGVPAIVVKPRSIADAYKLRQEWRTDTTLALFPAEVLTRLYATLGDARRVLSAVAMGAQALVAAAILLVILLHVGQRRRQIGALRAFGAPRLAVFAVVWMEGFALLGLGLLSGIGLGYGAALAIAARLQAQSGVALPVLFTADDLAPLLLLAGATAALAAVPALLAYRQSPAAALRG
ncbi:putative ABC transport system permease protein [Ancylobacter sp. 3268]|uniref:FtsX-like permease family protein n=1 Tax=Ancylobacter sp. 3268 TaxID=2817752 RepID=UPI00286231B4|nr:FtsX-like permease family protein [Ancylobacter sp. 3268]MDR6952279.1 putative ABC transport system permease protein [Ancylobacter sp. 3268]